MKLNITVEVDWIEEDGSIDEEVKHQIIDGVKRSISQSCLKKVEAQASKAIDAAINDSIVAAKKAIESRAIEFTNDWLTKEVTISDKWGDAQDCLTITDLIKRTFDGLLEKKVDSKGCFTDSYNSAGTLIKYLTGGMVQEVVSDRLKDMNKEMEAAITNAVNSGIRKNVSDKFAEMVIATAKAENKLLEMQ